MITVNDLSKNLELLKKQNPLVHNITNMVVTNVTANALLAIGASPIKFLQFLHTLTAYLNQMRKDY